MKMTRAEYASMKAAVAGAKKLDRKMVTYARETEKHLNVTFRQALEQMKIQADRVAKDLEVSQAFVVAWTTKELLSPLWK